MPFDVFGPKGPSLNVAVLAGSRSLQPSYTPTIIDSQFIPSAGQASVLMQTAYILQGPSSSQKSGAPSEESNQSVASSGLSVSLMRHLGSAAGKLRARGE